MFKIPEEKLTRIKHIIDILSDQNNAFLITAAEIKEARELSKYLEEEYYIKDVKHV